MALTAYPGLLSPQGAPYAHVVHQWTSGNVYFVHSGRGTTNNEGRDDQRPISSIARALTKMRATRGDVIIALPGHVETLTAAGQLVFNQAGVTLLGMGRGTTRPQINCTTAVGADIDINAANIYWENIRVTGGVDALTGPIDVNAADFAMINCETADVTGQATDFIVADATADRLTIIGHVHRGAEAAGADTWLTLVGGADAYIQPRWVDGNFAVAAIRNVTTAATNLTVCGSAAFPFFARTRNAADVILTAVAATTGNVGPFIYARLQDNAANITEAFVGAAMQFFQDIAIVNADGESSMLTNITASTDA